MKFAKVVVCGVGLIGGSFALALKAAGRVDKVVGLGRRVESLQDALNLGVIDEISTDWGSALDGAQLVMLAVPVGQMPRVMAEMAPFLRPGTYVTDGGSTKRDVVDAAYQRLGARVECFVPGHPIAGAEKSGASAARANLFRGRRVVLTPLRENPRMAVEVVRDAWRACGALVSETTPQLHDRTLAAVSHLPHLLSFALVHELAGRPNADRYFDLAAGGFRDFTRIASSHPEMWRDIMLANRDAVLAELSSYERELAMLRALIETGDRAGLEEVFARARAARDTWILAQEQASNQAG
ncbi:MAG: prephenate dehydrogenase/arogenate dehydrogenase family protein [Rhodocyclaceae bacterium]|nr:prephenate dehydrogenase/arogenate dehydrogenase family protein [Rhodocyclaceae bacterium]